MRHHPLDQLTVQELQTCVDIIVKQHKGKKLHIKSVNMEEPPKSLVVPYLQAEKSKLPLPHIPRIGYALYYVMDDKRAEELWIDLDENKIIKYNTLPKGVHPPMDQVEANQIETFMYTVPMVAEALEQCGITTEAQKKAVACDGWMYGCDEHGDMPRYLMFLMYSRDPKTNHPESNIYAFPLPFVPVYDILEQKFVRVDWCATGGDDDDDKAINYGTRTNGKDCLSHCRPNEYFPELVPNMRTDIKPYNVIQPDGPSFTVDGTLVQWQKWRFRVGFNPREGLVLYDVDYDGRNTFYRLSLSEMAVPYGDPRPPIHRKMAFDFGDVGGGRCANELTLGCDCLGVIKYFNGNLVEPNGEVVARKNVVCMHEQDDGLLWKHTNYRTDVPSVVRRRILVLQTILTVGNYEYIFAWHFDQAANINLEIRATGIVSTQPIDEGKRSKWGTIVSPGVLAASHQHIFSVRIDPAVDGHKNTAVVQETELVPWDAKNPKGTGFYNKKSYVEQSCAFDADVAKNKYVKIVNENKINPVTGNPVGYKLVPVPTALLMAPEGTVARSRAAFATHHFWVSKYKDQEFYAGGVWTNQSAVEVGGVQDAVDRKENVRNEDIVLWHSFGLTHHPRIEDFPVMPAEMLKMSLMPNDFFMANPSLDVPPSAQKFNRSVEVMQNRCCQKI